MYILSLNVETAFLSVEPLGIHYNYIHVHVYQHLLISVTANGLKTIRFGQH